MGFFGEAIAGKMMKQWLSGDRGRNRDEK